MKFGSHALHERVIETLDTKIYGQPDPWSFRP